MAIATVKFKRLEHGFGLPLPAYAKEGDAGMDICSAIDHALRPGDRFAIPTGFAVEIPSGFEGQVRPRSGLAMRHGLSIVNTPGTIDSGFRGEILILAVNHGSNYVNIERGMRIAQLVIAPVMRAEIEEVLVLSISARGTSGYGSTGA